MTSFNAVLSSIDDFVWGIPLIVLIMGTGIFLTIEAGARTEVHGTKRRYVKW